MPEISQFVVKEAYAEYDKTNNSLNLKFIYPRNPQEINTRLGPNPEFGISVLEKLISTGSARIATPENPISPPTAGSIPVFNDRHIVLCRRDDGAKVHKLYHAGYSGFARTPEELYSATGMRNLGKRESAEELILITKERNPYLIVTSSTKQETIKSAKRLGLENLPLKEVQEELIPGKDILNVYYEGGEHLFTLPCHFTMLWDIDASTIAMQIRKLNISSDEILPIDAESIFNSSGDKYKIHFNRESFIISPEDIVEYCYPMNNVQVFQSFLNNKGKRIIYTPQNSSLAYLGPGAVPVTKPYLWAPQDTARTCLDSLGFPDYKGKKLNWELKINKLFASNSARKKREINEDCVIPKKLLAKSTEY